MDVGQVKLEVRDIMLIGENDAGYVFGVGRIATHWIGFACGKQSPAQKAFASEGLPVDPQMLLVMPNVCDGLQLGVLDKARAILLTGAIAQDPESAYGGVDRWFVPEDQRGDPEKYRCRECGEVGCDGQLCKDDYPDW